MEKWRNGVRELWSYGVMELWSYGVMELWRNASLSLDSLSTPTHAESRSGCHESLGKQFVKQPYGLYGSYRFSVGM